MPYHAVLDIYMLFYVPVSPTFKKQKQNKTCNNREIQQQTNTQKFPGRNTSHNYWKFASACNILVAYILPCPDYIRVSFCPYVRGHERRVILFTLVLV